MIPTQAQAALRGRVILVIGASGFLGSALLPQLLGARPAEVRVLSRRPSGPDASEDSDLNQAVRLVVGDIRDRQVVREAVRGVHVVFHLAAPKTVEICEARPAEAIGTNVRGTDALLDAAVKEPSLERFLAVSSDKAANPIGVYGLTKALMERMVAEAKELSAADFGTVRCGSLWAGTDSVLSVWRAAALAGTALSVTEPEMTRFVMLRSEAIDLITEATSRRMEGSIRGRVLPAYLLGDLAAVLSEMNGVGIRTTGSRLGEKLHEDLVSEREAPFTERASEFFRITPGRRQAGWGPFSSSYTRRLTRPEIVELLGRPEVARV